MIETSIVDKQLAHMRLANLPILKPKFFERSDTEPTCMMDFDHYPDNVYSLPHFDIITGEYYKEIGIATRLYVANANKQIFFINELDIPYEIGESTE